MPTPCPRAARLALGAIALVLPLHGAHAQSRAPTHDDMVAVLDLRRELAAASSAVAVRREALAAARERVLEGSSSEAREIDELRDAYVREAAEHTEHLERIAGAEAREIEDFRRWREEGDARIAAAEQVVARARRAYLARKDEHDARVAALGRLVSRFNARVTALQRGPSNEPARRALVESLGEMQRGIQEGKADIGRLRSAALEHYAEFRDARQALEEARRQHEAERTIREEALSAERVRLNEEIESAAAELEVRRVEIQRRVGAHEAAARGELEALRSALDEAEAALSAEFGDDPAGLYDALGRWLESGDAEGLYTGDGATPRFQRTRPRIDAAYVAIERSLGPSAGSEPRIVVEPPTN